MLCVCIYIHGQTNWYTLMKRPGGKHSKHLGHKYRYTRTHTHVHTPWRTCLKWSLAHIHQCRYRKCVCICSVFLPPMWFCISAHMGPCVCVCVLGCSSCSFLISLVRHVVHACVWMLCWEGARSAPPHHWDNGVRSRVCVCVCVMWFYTLQHPRGFQSFCSATRLTNRSVLMLW